MILPCVLGITVFVMIPLVLALYRSLFEYRVYSEVQEWVGLGNYIQILSTELFVDSFLNVFLLTACVVVLMVLLSFFFAHVINNVGPGFSKTVRAIIYIPCLISGIAASIIFLFLTNYSGGLINGILLSLDKIRSPSTERGFGLTFRSFILRSGWDSDTTASCFMRG